MAVTGNIRKVLWKILSNKPVVFILLLLVSMGCAFLLASGLTKVPLIIVGALIGIIILYYCLVHPLIGFYIVTFISFFVAYPERMLKMQVPLSTGIEVLVLILFIGSYTMIRRPGSSDFYKTPVSVAFFIYILLVIVEFFNPNMHSLEGWIFYMRRLVMFILIYVVSYRLFDDMNKIKVFF